MADAVIHAVTGFPVAAVVLGLVALVSLVGGIAVMVFFREREESDEALQDDYDKPSATASRRSTVPHSIYITEPSLGHALSFAPQTVEV
jgi:hypothetical protein